MFPTQQVTPKTTTYSTPNASARTVLLNKIAEIRNYDAKRYQYHVQKPIISPLIKPAPVFYETTNVYNETLFQSFLIAMSSHPSKMAPMMSALMTSDDCHVYVAQMESEKDRKMNNTLASNRATLEQLATMFDVTIFVIHPCLEISVYFPNGTEVWAANNYIALVSDGADYCAYVPDFPTDAWGISQRRTAIRRCYGNYHTGDFTIVDCNAKMSFGTSQPKNKASTCTTDNIQQDDDIYRPVKSVESVKETKPINTTDTCSTNGMFNKAPINQHPNVSSAIQTEKDKLKAAHERNIRQIKDKFDLDVQAANTTYSNQLASLERAVKLSTELIGAACVGDLASIRELTRLKIPLTSNDIKDIVMVLFSANDITLFKEFQEVYGNAK